MSLLKLMFFVNGSETSAAGVRAQTFAQKLPPGWQIRFNYRPSPKWKGVVPFIQSAAQFKPDIVYVMDTAYTGVLAGYVAKRLLGCKLVTDTGDIAFELAKSVGTYSKTQLALIQWVEQLAMQESDYIVVRGSYHKHWLENQGKTAVEFIPDGVDMSAIELLKAADLKRELGLETQLVVGLVGSMAWSKRHRMCYGWDIVEAMALVKDLPIMALLVGDGDGRKLLEQRAEQLGLSDHIIFAGQIPYPDLPRYLAAMDICVSTQSNDLVGMVRTTGKLPLYLAYGKYVIATNVGEAQRVLPDIGCLLPYEGVRDEDHPVRLAEHLRFLLAESQSLDVATAAQQAAKDNFDYNMLAKRLEKVCQSLVEF
jgi:glycosyltransferase involved in cell wall biosynthesis